MIDERLPVFFVPHGGGPWPLLDGEMLHAHASLAEHLRAIDGLVGRRPRAIVMISAHWDELIPTINAAAQPPMLYDYGGFPEHTYRFSYGAPGSPEVAQRIDDLFTQAHIEHAIELRRGYDHGAFVPLMVAYPDANIPVVQISLRSDLDPRAHLEIGRALAPLRDEGALILATGMSFHNMRGFRQPTPALVQAGRDFDSWLVASLVDTPQQSRDAAIEAWAAAPGARAAHPAEDHLVPLFVAAGAGGSDRATLSYADTLLGYPVSGFRFG